MQEEGSVKPKKRKDFFSSKCLVIDRQLLALVDIFEAPRNFTLREKYNIKRSGYRYGNRSAFIRSVIDEFMRVELGE